MNEMDIAGSPEERDLRLDDQLCFALYAATNAITRLYRPLLKAIDLTYPQYLVLLALWQDGTLTIGAIAKRLQLGANAVTPLVDQLASAGLVNRVPVASDRRQVAVALTEAGVALKAAAAQAQAEVSCATGLDFDEQGVLRAELGALTTRMSQNEG